MLPSTPPSLIDAEARASALQDVAEAEWTVGVLASFSTDFQPVELQSQYYWLRSIIPLTNQQTMLYIVQDGDRRTESLGARRMRSVLGLTRKFLRDIDQKS